MTEVDGLAARLGHAASVTATKDGAKVAGIFNVGVGVAQRHVVEHHTRHNPHGCAVHVFGEGLRVRQVQRVELRAVACQVGTLHGAQHALVNIMFSIFLVCFHHILSVVAQERVVDDNV